MPRRSRPGLGTRRLTTEPADYGIMSWQVDPSALDAAVALGGSGNGHDEFVLPGVACCNTPCGWLACSVPVRSAIFNIRGAGNVNSGDTAQEKVLLPQRLVADTCPPAVATHVVLLIDVSRSAGSLLTHVVCAWMQEMSLSRPWFQAGNLANSMMRCATTSTWHSFVRRYVPGTFRRQHLAASVS